MAGPAIHELTRPQRREFPLKGTIDYQGVVIDVENPPSSTRSGTSPDGTKWSVQMPKDYAYGEVRHTEGADGDAIDAFVGPDPFAPFVYVFQMREAPGRKAFDETKAVLGAPSKGAAFDMIRHVYDRPGFIIGCTTWSIGAWRTALERQPIQTGRMDRPLVKGRLVIRLAKAAPGPGWEPVGSHGGFRRRNGSTWEYRYPDGRTDQHAAIMHPLLGAAHDRLHPHAARWVFDNSGQAKADLFAEHAALPPRLREMVDADAAETFHREHGDSHVTAYRSLRPGDDPNNLGGASMSLDRASRSGNDVRAFRVHHSDVLLHPGMGGGENALSSRAFGHEREIILKPSAKPVPVDDLAKAVQRGSEAAGQLHMFGPTREVHVGPHMREGHPVAAHVRMIHVAAPHLDPSRRLTQRPVRAYNADTVWEPAAKPTPMMREDAVTQAAPETVHPFASPDEIDAGAAQGAHYGTSFVPERRGEQERQSYAAALNEHHAQLHGMARTPEEHAIAERHAHAAKARYRSAYLGRLGAMARTTSVMITGGSGRNNAREQKRSDTADRRTGELLEVLPQSVTRFKKELAAHRIQAAGGEVAVLEQKLADAKEFQNTAKAANKIARRTKLSDDEKVAAIVAELGFKEDTARGFLEKDFAGRLGVPTYRLTNNLANIKRMEGRLVELRAKEKVRDALEAETGETSSEHEFTGSAEFPYPGTVEYDHDEQRIRLKFDARLPREKFDAIQRGTGFKWSRKHEAFSHVMGATGAATARRITGADLPDLRGPATGAKPEPPMDADRAQTIGTTAWYLGSRGEPVEPLLRHEEGARAHGVDIRAEHARGAADRA